MEKHDHSQQGPGSGTGFWQSRTGLALIVFLVIAGILLGYEHRIHIFGGNSGPLLFLVFWIGIHFFMHRGHGGHGGHGGHAGHGSQGEPRAKALDDQTKDSGEKP